MLHRLFDILKYVDPPPNLSAWVSVIRPLFCKDLIKRFMAASTCLFPRLVATSWRKSGCPSIHEDPAFIILHKDLCKDREVERASLILSLRVHFHPLVGTRNNEIGCLIAVWEASSQSSSILCRSAGVIEPFILSDLKSL